MINNISHLIRNVAISVPTDTDLVDVFCNFGKTKIDRNAYVLSEQSAVAPRGKGHDPRIATLIKILHMRRRKTEAVRIGIDSAVVRKVDLSIFFQSESVRGGGNKIPLGIVHHKGIDILFKSSSNTGIRQKVVDGSGGIGAGADPLQFFLHGRKMVFDRERRLPNRLIGIDL